MVERAIAEGAKVIPRGGPITDGTLAKGAFYRPTMLEVTNPKMTIAQEEVFGPVLTMMGFDSEEEAVRLANDSEYGLAASIWTRDVERPLRVARRSTPARFGLTIGLSRWTNSKKADSRKAETAVSTVRRRSGTFWSTSTSRSTPASSVPQLAFD